jgi:DNA-binding LacI/PurR family transcriptional regulator
VLLDMNSMIANAYKHLVQRGARRIALINHNQPVDGLRLMPDTKGHRSLETDLLIRLSADGPGFDPRLIRTCHPTPKQGYEAMKQLWSVPENRPDGLIISDDNMASGVGQAVVDMGIATPSQLKIVTHATNGVDRDFPFVFTQSQFDLHRISVGAFSLLYRMMIGQPTDGLIMKAAIKQGATT